jgi:tRNA(Ile)-lysidine synthase TilS/MesJ
LYRLAASVGATKIALGHHLDDFVETLLLNLFFQGKLKAMPARLISDNKRHIVIRPLVYVTEADARAYTQESGLPVIGCCCPACGDLSLKRQRLKRLLAEFEVEHPDVKSSMMAAMSDVALAVHAGRYSSMIHTSTASAVPGSASSSASATSAQYARSRSMGVLLESLKQSIEANIGD